MKIARKESKVTEDMLSDMYAQILLEKYFKKKYGDCNSEGYLSLSVWIDKDTGADFLYDMAIFDNYEECKEDDKLNRTLFGSRCNCYSLFITGKRVVISKDKAIIILIEAEAIEH